MTKLFSKYDYNPIIKNIFGKKITFSNLTKLAVLWIFYVEFKIKKNVKRSDIFNPNYNQNTLFYFL